MSADSQPEFVAAQRLGKHLANVPKLGDIVSDRQFMGVTHSYPHQISARGLLDDIVHTEGAAAREYAGESEHLGIRWTTPYGWDEDAVRRLKVLLSRVWRGRTRASWGSELESLASMTPPFAWSVKDMLAAHGSEDLEEDQHVLLKQRIEELAREASQEGWDGAGSAAVRDEAVAGAKRFIDALPCLGVLPEVAATSRGELRFDWAPSSSCTLGVTVGISQRIAFSGLFADTLVSGKEPWEGDLPPLLHFCIERLRSYESEGFGGGGSHRDISERRLRHRVLEAVEGADEAWQDAASIARRSALPEELVLKVLYEDSSDVIYEQFASGKVVFSTRRHFLGNASAAQKLLGAFRNRLR